MTMIKFKLFGIEMTKGFDEYTDLMIKMFHAWEAQSETVKVAENWKAWMDKNTEVIKIWKEA